MATVVLANSQGSQKRSAPTFDRRIRRAKECLPFHVDALLMSGFLVMHLPQRLPHPTKPSRQRPMWGAQVATSHLLPKQESRVLQGEKNCSRDKD